MGILSWDKPEKARSSESHAAMYVADSAPPGTYVPNMSKEDVWKWKAKFTGHKAGHPQVEIRYGGGLVIIVCLHDGYRYKGRRPEGRTTGGGYTYGATIGSNLHIATNGPLIWTFEHFDEMVEAIAEAKQFLEDYYDNQ